MSGAAGSNIAAAGAQPAIGAYVQDTLDPSANTNVIGVNTKTAWKTNVMGYVLADAVTAPCNDNAATGGVAQYVQASAVIADSGRCNIVAGVATANATGTHVCYVDGGVVAGDYFWAPTFA